MRKALFVTLVLLLQFTLFAADENRGGSLKYNYVVETNLSLPDFSQAFVERVRSKHNWSEEVTNACSEGVCISSWNFTDDESHKWKCEVVIKKSIDNSNAMVVSMEMNPVIGS